MKNIIRKIVIICFLCLLPLTACNSSKSDEGFSESDDGSSAGILTPATDVVEFGSDIDLLQRIQDFVEFYAGDVVRVTQGGEATLDFGDSLLLRLFNDTEMNVDTASEPEASFDVQFYLWAGGFTGELTEPGGQAVFTTPGGVKITVLGTEFFVTYDPSTEQTTVGNFHGSVEVESSGTSVSLEDGFFVVIQADQPPESPQSLVVKKDEFEETARNLKSPIMASQTVGEWLLSMEYRAKGPSLNELTTWSGTFVIKDDGFIGSGDGKIESSYVCDLGSYEYLGTFTFEISGKPTIDQDNQIINFLPVGKNLELTSPDKNYCAEISFDFYFKYYERLISNYNSVLGDIELEARDGASITKTETYDDNSTTQLNVLISREPGGSK